MPISQLFNPVFQKLSLPLRTQGFSSNSLNFNIRHRIDDNRREDILQAADDVAFDDLGSDIGDESLLRDLYDAS